jgi:putative transposase
VSSAEHERLLRRARAQDVALFRYRLIGPALEEGLTGKQRGRVVRGIAGKVHAGPGGRAVQVSRKTIDTWIRAWRTGGFEALLPSDRKCEPVTAPSVLAMAAALKRENTQRTAAQVRRIMVAQAGDAPPSARCSGISRARTWPPRAGPWSSAGSRPRPRTCCG